MKSSKPHAAARTLVGATPARTPRYTFCISLCSFPVHCDTDEIPFLKCHNSGWVDMAQKCSSIAVSPTIALHHLMKWSLKTHLWSWWRMSGKMQEKILQWGKSAQNGE